MKMLDETMGKADTHAKTSRNHIESSCLTVPKSVANEAPESIEKDGWTKVKRKRSVSSKQIGSTDVPATKLEANEKHHKIAK